MKTNPKTKNGFTVIELIITCAILGILSLIGFNAVTGNIPFNSRESCIAQGGKWTEGIQFGKHTAICTYD